MKCIMKSQRQFLYGLNFWSDVITWNWWFMKNSIWLFKGYCPNVKLWEPLAERKRYINFKDQIQQLNVTRVAWNLICLKIIHVVLWMWNIFHWNLFFFFDCKHWRGQGKSLFLTNFFLLCIRLALWSIIYFFSWF